MILPRNGRIVVIDDKTEEEAIPLLSSLYLNGFSALYFKGEKKDLPRKPLNDIRMIFLDLEIIVEGYTGQDNRSKAATTARILSSVINTTIPTIYLLAFWSTHEELLEYFWRYIKENNYNCIFLPVSLDKIKCRAADYDIALIEKEIEEKLQGNDGFRFLIGWENLIHKSSNDVINEILSLYGGDGNPDKFLLRIFKKLAEEYAGKNLNASDHEQIVRYAMLAFNGTFADTLENNIADAPDTGISFNDITEGPGRGITAKINSKLLLDQNNTIPKPGSIYINSEYDDVQEYFKINHGNNPSEIEKVFCEVSPTCDYAQRKWKCHRILYGLKVPAGAAKLEKADYLYKTDIFDIDGQAVKFIFDLRKLKSKNLGELDLLKPLCTFRHDLLVVIQHKIASHCSRPGTLSL